MSFFPKVTHISKRQKGYKILNINAKTTTHEMALRFIINQRKETWSINDKLLIQKNKKREENKKMEKSQEWKKTKKHRRLNTKKRQKRKNIDGTKKGGEAINRQFIIDS